MHVPRCSKPVFELDASAPQILKDPEPYPRMLDDRSMYPGIDLKYGAGFIQAANKKKAKQAAKAAQNAKWNEGDGEDPPQDEGNGDGDKGADKGGDAGDAGDAGGAGDAGDDKKDESKDKDAVEATADDVWESFVPAKGKKKGKKGGKADEPASTTTPAEKLDSFQEISLGDTGPSLDLSFDTGQAESKPANSFGSWGTTWNTGSGSNWNFSATNATETTTDAKKDDIDSNPWSLNRGKPTKKKDTFAFGSFDEEAKDDSKSPPADTEGTPEDTSGFATATSKKDKKKKKSMWSSSWDDDAAKEDEAKKDEHKEEKTEPEIAAGMC